METFVQIVRPAGEEPSKYAVSKDERIGQHRILDYNKDRAVDNLMRLAERAQSFQLFSPQKELPAMFHDVLVYGRTRVKLPTAGPKEDKGWDYREGWMTGRRFTGITSPGPGKDVEKDGMWEWLNSMDVRIDKVRCWMFLPDNWRRMIRRTDARLDF